MSVLLIMENSNVLPNRGTEHRELDLQLPYLLPEEGLKEASLGKYENNIDNSETHSSSARDCVLQGSDIRLIHSATYFSYGIPNLTFN